MDKKTHIKIGNFILSIILIGLFTYLQLNYREEYFIYEDNTTKEYSSMNLETYNASMPPWKECTQEFPMVCYWHNVPTSKDDIFIYKVNPVLGFIYSWQYVITLIICALFVIINFEQLKGWYLKIKGDQK